MGGHVSDGAHGADSVRTGGQADSNMARLVQLAALLVSVRALRNYLATYSH